MKKIAAFARLAIAFGRHVLLVPFVNRRGLAEVSRDYAPDGVRNVSPAERAAGPALSRCTGCGRCDGLVPEGDPPSLVLLYAAREGSDAPFVARKLRALAPYAQAIREMCPEDVDVPSLILRVERLAHGS
jgi:ferredoxin